MNVLKQLLSRIRTIQAGFETVLPPTLFAGYLFFGVLLLAATSACGLGQFPVNERVKGFFWELNWGINHLVFIPVGLFCCALVMSEAWRQVDRLCGARLLVDSEFQPIASDRIRTDWKFIRPGPILFGIIVSVAILEAWIEWWSSCARPIFGLARPESLRAIGWTAGAFADPSINKAANVLLSFLAFTAQGLVVSYFCYTVAVGLKFAIWIYRYDDGPERKIIPDIASGDERLGFEEFEPLLLRLLWMALAFTFVFFSIRMQIVYDNSQSSSVTALEFVLRDVVAGFFVNVAAIFAGQKSDLFEISLAPVFAMAVSCGAMIVTVSLVTAFPTLILYFLAQDSRKSLERCLALANCPVCDSREKTKEDCQKRLKKMDFWPMQYPRPVELLAYIVFAGICFIFYRFTVVLFGMLAMRLVYATYQILSRKVAAPESVSSN